MEYTYVTLKAGDVNRKIPISKEPLTIGRHEGNKLVLAEHMASRFHCVIERKDTGYLLRDLQSRNGTLLNNQRVINSMLKSGDVIAIGTTTLTFVMHEASKEGPRTYDRGVKKAPPPKPVEEEELDDMEVVDEMEVVEEEPEGELTPLGKMRRTADNMLNHDFDVDAITLINTRGKVAHDAEDNSSGTSETVLLFRLALLLCFRSHASDIHVEPRAEDFLLRIRVDGNLLDIASFPKELGTRFMALVKILGELDTTQRSIVQEGHFAARAPAPSINGIAPTNKFRRVDYRVSFVPSLHGQKLVVRIFDAANAPSLIAQVGFPHHVEEQVAHELTLDAGLLLVCGPTGSGKTTTLYSLLRSCGSSFRNIITIEDPVEVQIEGTTQLPVDEANGKTFAALLKSVLRQDPDVIMVGEIRDSETARIALQASVTGHLVLSTIHTRDCVGSVFRLLDLGVEPYMVAQGLHIVISQRLVRTLCEACRRPIKPTADDYRRMGKYGESIKKIYAPVGCPKCLGTGYVGRRAFFEFLAATQDLQDQIMKNPSPEDLRKHLGDGFVSLAHAGYELVAQGYTSVDEVDRAVGK